MCTQIDSLKPTWEGDQVNFIKYDEREEVRCEPKVPQALPQDAKAGFRLLYVQQHLNMTVFPNQFSALYQGTSVNIQNV